jgi:hypothetical protein
MKFWPAEKYARDWMYAKVRLTKDLPTAPKDSLGMIVEWRNGWPVVLFSPKVNGAPVDVVELTKERDALWLPCRLDDLEKVP